MLSKVWTPMAWQQQCSHMPKLAQPAQKPCIQMYYLRHHISFLTFLSEEKCTAWLDTFRVIIANGKFHGVIAPTTPTGCSAKKKERTV
jgi:hypothetical protein